MKVLVFFLGIILFSCNDQYNDSEKKKGLASNCEDISLIKVEYNGVRNTKMIRHKDSIDLFCNILLSLSEEEIAKFIPLYSIYIKHKGFDEYILIAVAAKNHITIGKKTYRLNKKESDQFAKFIDE